MLLYAVILLVVIASLLWVYRSMGGGGPVSAVDLRVTVADLVTSTSSAAQSLRAALGNARAAGEGEIARLNGIAEQCRKDFQGSYYRALRLRPHPTDRALTASSLAARDALLQALEDYEWASRMASAEVVHNAAIRQAVAQLVDAGDAACAQARRTLAGA